MSERKPSARLGRRLAVLTVGLGLIGLGLPTTALAHGIVGRADLPIPSWLFAWTAALVMVISFVALFRLWSKPRGRTPSQLLLRTPQFLEWFCGAIGLFLFAAVVVAGLWGAQNFTSNLAPTFIYVIFWVGIPITSAFFGDISGPSIRGGRLHASPPGRCTLLAPGQALCSATTRSVWVAGRPPSH